MLAGAGCERGRATAARAGDYGMAKFDADTLRELRDVKELRIRTEKHPKTAVVIWIVVADDEVFVRSWLGPRGRWGSGPRGRWAPYWSSGRRIEVNASPVNDADSIARASAKFLRKYEPSSHAREMVRSEILSATLRLEPR